MTVNHLLTTVGSPSSTLFDGAERRPIASYERELSQHRITRARLREALVREAALLRRTDELIRQQQILNGLFAAQDDAQNRLAQLTPRQLDIMDLVLAGRPNKIIAADLGISQRTVENHRARVMRKTGSKSVAALTRFALAAAWNGAPGRASVLDAGDPDQSRAEPETLPCDLKSAAERQGRLQKSRTSQADPAWNS